MKWFPGRQMISGCVFFFTASSCTDTMDAYMGTRLSGRKKVVWLGCGKVMDNFRPNPKTLNINAKRLINLSKHRDSCFRSLVTNCDILGRRDGKANDSGCTLQKAAGRYFPRQLLKGRLNFSKIRRAPARWNASRPPLSTSSYDNSCCVGNLMLMKELKAGWWAISVTHLWIEHTPGVRLRTGVTQWIEATPREFFLE